MELASTLRLRLMSQSVVVVVLVGLEKVVDDGCGELMPWLK